MWDDIILVNPGQRVKKTEMAYVGSGLRGHNMCPCVRECMCV